MIAVPVILLLLAALVAAVAVLGVTGKLPRNRWAGVRTPASLESDEKFALANRVASPAMAGSAVLLAIGAFAWFALDGWSVIAAIVVCVAAALVVAGLGGSIAARAAAAVPAAATGGSTGGCGHACTSCSLKDACQPS